MSGRVISLDEARQKAQDEDAEAYWDAVAERFGDAEFTRLATTEGLAKALQYARDAKPSP